MVVSWLAKISQGRHFTDDKRFSKKLATHGGDLNFNGYPVTIKDSMMGNDEIEVTATRYKVFPCDEMTSAVRTDVEAMNQSLSLSVRPTSSSLANVAERLDAWRLEMSSQVFDLRRLDKEFKEQAS
ncbi:PREDICTED: uncharacterized protein LOC105117739 [Populus euphratica]|uniref:Uncharacterized protein LOC105117739 n=1 Tax=Populus euphratica TaxID=75702 RepID=A0AAJ6TNK2_POPEU|nr:PREDICTED: uncharacterized protein LOC105117739 [Populus euphratica]